MCARQHSAPAPGCWQRFSENSQEWSSMCLLWNLHHLVLQYHPESWTYLPQWCHCIRLSISKAIMSFSSGKIQILRTFENIFVMKGPGRHFVSNALWIIINMFCLIVTFYHLRRLDKEYKNKQTQLTKTSTTTTTTTTDDESKSMMMSKRIKMYWILTSVHCISWLPLYTDTFLNRSSLSQHRKHGLIRQIQIVWDN